MIAIRNLFYSYAGQPAMRFPDIDVPSGAHCLLLGQSGSGKTTLLHIVGGLLRNYQGSTAVAGTELASLSESALDGFRGSNMGFVFQKNHLISALSVEKNIAMAAYLAGRPVDTAAIERVMHRLGLTEKRHAGVSQISQGQAQRVAIARAILNKPAVILADEPTSALDDHSCEQVITLLTEVASESNASLLIATHDQRLKSKIAKTISLTHS